MDGRSECEICSSVCLCIYSLAIVALGMTVICENMLRSRHRLWNIWQYFERWCWSLGTAFNFSLWAHPWRISSCYFCQRILHVSRSSLPIKKDQCSNVSPSPVRLLLRDRAYDLPFNLGHSSEISRMKKDTYFRTFFQTLTTENNSRPCSDLAALHPKSVSVTSYLLPRSQRWRLFLLLCAVPLLGLRLHFQLLRPLLDKKKWEN